MPGIIDFFQDQGDSYLDMEYIKGKTLGQQLAEIYKLRGRPQFAIEVRLRLLEIVLEVFGVLFNYVLKIFNIEV